MKGHSSRREFLVGGAAVWMAAAGPGSVATFARSPQAQRGRSIPASGLVAQDLALVNGKIYTMDGSKRVVSRALIQNGRFTAVGNSASTPRGVKVVDLR